MTEPTSLIMSLNTPQQEAATHLAGPLVVFAGAGSGKTRVITTRIAYLIAQGVKPWEILAVTFTNKAAAEMRQRVEQLTSEGRRAMVTTFHSACARWLREFANELGYEPHFTIFDENDSKAALKKVLQELKVPGDPAKVLAEYRHFIHDVKTAGLFPKDAEAYLQQQDQGPSAGPAVYKAYQEYLARCQAMDFNDLLLNMLLLLRHNQKVIKIMQERYQYILVDEFQDTNRTQFELLHILSKKHQNLFVVGDDDQSIYSWRGATPGNIIDFRAHYPGAKEIKLEQNYRCTSNIVDAASALIANNTYRAAKTLFSLAASGDLIDYHVEPDQEMEAYWVASEILREKARFDYREIAVFYRTNSQSRALEDALRRENIPYTIYGSLEFYARMEIKDLLAYFRLIVNPNDDVSWRRIINIPARGLGDKAVEVIDTEARRRGLSLLETTHALAGEDWPKIGPKLRLFSDLMKALQKDLTAAPLEDVLGIILEATEYKEYLKKKYADQYDEKVDNIFELGSAMAEYSKTQPTAKLTDWLQVIALNQDDKDEPEQNGVSLMTFHMAKGLEFRRVFLVGVEDGLLPHSNSMDDLMQLEEERRLMYVGMTRAKEKLSLISAHRRRFFNNYSANPPSRFIEEIPLKYLQPMTEMDHIAGGGTHYDYSPTPSADELTRGAVVYHPTFGRGTVINFEHVRGQMKVIVLFDEHGQRLIRPSQLEFPR